MKPLWTAVVALGMAGAAWADDEFKALQEQAGRERADELKELRDRLDKVEKQQSSAGQTWDASKMLSFSTADGNFTAKIGGRIFVDYRHIFDREDTGAAGADSFWVDTARFQLDGTFFKDFMYRVEAEAKSGENAASTAPFRTKDVYIGWNLGEILTLKGGQMKVPFSAEETCSSRFIDFAERSIINRWMPAHNQGFLLNGAFADKIFEWTLGVMNTAVSRDGGKGSQDASDEKDLVGRLFVSPFRNGSGILKNLRLGFDFTIGDVDNFPQADITSGDLGGTILTDFAVTTSLDGMRERMLGSFAWAYGPFSVRAEYGVITQELQDGLPESEYEVTMWLAQATWLITGEDKVIDNRIKPKNNFAPLSGGWGAFELAVRAAAYEVGDEVQTAGVALVAATGNLETQEVTVGLNWWWAPNVVWRFNYEMLSFDEDIANLKTGGEADDKQDIFIVRWQIDF